MLTLGVAGLRIHSNVTKYKPRRCIYILSPSNHHGKSISSLPTTTTPIITFYTKIKYPSLFLKSFSFPFSRTLRSLTRVSLLPNHFLSIKTSTIIDVETPFIPTLRHINTLSPHYLTIQKHKLQITERPSTLEGKEKHTVKVLVLNIQNGWPIETLALLEKTLSPGIRMEFMYALTLTLISIPYNQVDPRAEWDECVTLVLNKFIEILKANPSLSPEEPPCHHSILIYGVLARCISRRRLSSLVAHMETLSDKFNFPHHQFKVHQSLIQMYNFTKNFEKSISYFNLILPQVDITMLGSVSNAYAALGKPNSVLELMELGKKLGLMKDSKENFILNRNVIDAAVKQGGLDGALLYLNEHLLDLPPSMLGEILSRILYWGTLEAPFTHASLIFELAKSKGCSLTSAGMASLMSNYIASKFYDKALEIFFGFKYPSEHMYALALEAASKTLPSTFFELHDSAIAAHLNGFLKLSGTYFYPFIKLVYTMNGYDAALKSLQSMVSLGLSIPPNIQIQMLIWKHSSEIMEQPIEALSTYLKPFKTYRVTYILLIKDLLEKHHVIQAVDFLHFLLLENTTGKIFSIDANILSLYIDYFGQQKCPELLRILVALVKSLNKVTEKEPVFLSALLKAYSHMGQYEKAFEIWDGYVYSKKTPPLNMIASVLDTCGFAQDLRRLNEIVEFIVEKGYGVNINIWTSAIEAYLRLNHIQGVKKVFSKWIPSSGVQIDDKCLGTLLSMSKDTELDEELLQVVRHYFHEHPDTTIKKWYSLDSLSYSPSIHSFYKFSEKHSFKKPNSLEIINN